MVPELGSSQNVIRIFLDPFVLPSLVLQSGCYSSASFLQITVSKAMGDEGGARGQTEPPHQTHQTGRGTPALVATTVQRTGVEGKKIKCK